MTNKTQKQTFYGAVSNRGINLMGAANGTVSFSSLIFLGFDVHVDLDGTDWKQTAIKRTYATSLSSKVCGLRCELTKVTIIQFEW